MIGYKKIYVCYAKTASMALWVSYVFEPQTILSIVMLWSVWAENSDSSSDLDYGGYLRNEKQNTVLMETFVPNTIISKVSTLYRSPISGYRNTELVLHSIDNSVNGRIIN